MEMLSGKCNDLCGFVCVCVCAYPSIHCSNYHRPVWGKLSHCEQKAGQNQSQL